MATLLSPDIPRHPPDLDLVCYSLATRRPGDPATRVPVVSSSEYQRVSRMSDGHGDATGAVNRKATSERMGGDR